MNIIMRKETYSKCDAATVHFNNEVAPVSKAREKKTRPFYYSILRDLFNTYLRRFLSSDSKKLSAF